MKFYENIMLLICSSILAICCFDFRTMLVRLPLKKKEKNVTAHLTLVTVPTICLVKISEGNLLLGIALFRETGFKWVGHFFQVILRRFCC